MCIIGMAVDVHAKDGSVYSGIFHTASVDKDYAIVLKKAKMIKKGNLDTNVGNGTLIETLIVHSEDLVQVVAKGVILPSDGMAGYVGGDGMMASTGYIEFPDRDAEVVKTNESKRNYENRIQSRLSNKKKNELSYRSTVRTANSVGRHPEDYSEKLDARNIEKIQIEEADNVFDDGRHIRDGSQETQRECQNSLEFKDKRTSGEVQDSSLSITSCEAQSASALQGVSAGRAGALEDQDQEKATADGTASIVASQPNVSVASTPIINVKSESCLSASSNPFLLLPPKGSSVKRTAKESKLNPGAKMFSPSMRQHRTMTPPAVPNGATDPYMPRTYTMAPMATPREEVDGNSFTHSSVPVKFVPYNNIAFGHGGNDAPYVQPVIGQVVNRTQPIRYSGQYQNLQTSYAYVHPNSQNVMLGRGPLACMHPFSSDVVQSASGFSPAAIRPLSALHQVHPPKHQGNASAQALQLCMTPPIMANVPQPFIIPTSIPISQPLFPVLRPMAVPGNNGFLSTKFA
ncbi:hypothetical protein C2S51_009810 [Perilla frutescens var. frutescens]|nr:hypothetical protein C2S51_009810 [Perilla frutescens var. frutescens]